MNEKEFEKENVFGLGQPNDAFAQYFIGKSYLNPLTDPSKTSLFLANVTFEPGCRNNWHIHHASSGGGQILICTAGFGWYQEEGKEAQSLKLTSNTGMVQRKILGLVTLQLKFLVKKLLTNGANLLQMRNITNYVKIESSLN